MKFNDQILIKLDEMSQYLHELEELLPHNEEEYLENRKTRRACEKTVELAIESVVSIVSKIVSHNKFGVPQDEDSLIDILQEKKVISNELSEVLHDMKGFRNILVHKYGKVDDHKSFIFLTEQLGDFDTFAREVREYLKKTL